MKCEYVRQEPFPGCMNFLGQLFPEERFYIRHNQPYGHSRKGEPACAADTSSKLFHITLVIIFPGKLKVLSCICFFFILPVMALLSARPELTEHGKHGTLFLLRVSSMDE
jgi:hypothetical protein